MKPLIAYKRARYDFDILEKYEAGVVLPGSAVKSVRAGVGKLEGAYVIVRGDEAFLVGANIPPYQPANAPRDYDAEAPRKLLLSRKEIRELFEKSEQKGLTIVPLMMYNVKNKVKVEIGVARGKKKFDKRENIKERDTRRSIERTLKRQG